MTAPHARTPLRLDVSATPQGRLVLLAGRLDARSAPDVRLALHDVVDETVGTLDLDLGDLVVGDRTGLGLLVEVLSRSRRRGCPVRVVAAEARTERLLRAVRLGAVLASTGPAAGRREPARVAG